MECYSSESSGSGSETEASLAVKTLDYSYLMLNDAALYSHIEEVSNLNSVYFGRNLLWRRRF
jgi:hypothetical protein